MISMIAAMAKNNRAIGKDNKLMWRIPKDLERFKSITNGHPIIMGRKTFESIGRPLPNRTNIIITRNDDYTAPGCIVDHTLDEAIQKAQSIDEREIFIIGGGQIYEQGIQVADKLYLTLVDGDFEGDAFFPDYSEFKTVIHTESGDSNGISYTFLDLER